MIVITTYGNNKYKIKTYTNYLVSYLKVLPNSKTNIRVVYIQNYKNYLLKYLEYVALSLFLTITISTPQLVYEINIHYSGWIIII